MLMKMIANGKLNLSLYVTGVCGGMHLLDGVMHSVSPGDELTAEESDRVRVTMLGAECPTERNTAYRAAILIRDRYGLSLDISIAKHIPVGGGMGGSSADAAGVLACAERMLAGRGVNADLSDIAAAVGSDVSFMMRGGCARVRGTGGDVTALPPMEFDALAIDCGAVDTAACYRTFDELALPFSSPTEGELLSPFNALRPAAERLNGRLRDCAETAKRLGVAVSMTGSGGCMFVISPPAGTADAFREAGFRCFPVRSAACGVVFV